MTITLYVNWEYQEIYRDEEELINGYIDQCCDDDHFKCWLDDEYASDEIFDMTQSRKEEVKESYREYLLLSARNWAYNNNMEQEINI